MFDWLRRVFWSSGGDERQQLFRTLDTLNAEAGGGEPIRTSRVLGRLSVPSRSVVLADPQYLPGLEVSRIASDEVVISASLWQYPSGATTVTALKLNFDDGAPGGLCRKIGEVAIDSAKLVVADKDAFEEHWTQVGKDRVGVISTARDDTMLQLLTKRFKLRTTRVNPVRAEVVGPVSDTLAKEIEGYLKSNPEYAKYPYMHFYVQTNNSFERANFLAKEWAFLPVGNADTPVMFVCGTGRGDGCYDVECEFAGEIPRALSISFIEE